MRHRSSLVLEETRKWSTRFSEFTFVCVFDRTLETWTLMPTPRSLDFDADSSLAQIIQFGYTRTFLSLSLFLIISLKSLQT